MGKPREELLIATNGSTVTSVMLKPRLDPLMIGKRLQKGRTKALDPLPVEERVPVELDIGVWGMGADGHAFSQHAHTQNISSSGALLCELDHELTIGDTIGLQVGQKKTRCKVVWAKNTRSPHKIQAGVQLLNKPECPWTAYLPQTHEPGSAKPHVPRKWGRHKISFPITLQDDRAPVRVSATDISGSGCYIEMLSPFPVGTALGAELWIGSDRMRTRALVRTSDPRVGMGIAFIGLKVEDQQRIQNHLQAIDPFNCSIEHPGPRSRRSPS